MWGGHKLKNALLFQASKGWLYVDNRKKHCAQIQNAKPSKKSMLHWTILEEQLTMYTCFHTYVNDQIGRDFEAGTSDDSKKKYEKGI